MCQQIAVPVSAYAIAIVDQTERGQRFVLQAPTLGNHPFGDATDGEAQSR